MDDWAAEVDATLGACLEMLLHAGADPSARVRVRATQAPVPLAQGLEGEDSQSHEQEGQGASREHGSATKADGVPASASRSSFSHMRIASSKDLRAAVRDADGVGRSSHQAKGSGSGEQVERNVVRVKSRLRLGTGKSALELGLMSSSGRLGKQSQAATPRKSGPGR